MCSGSRPSDLMAPVVTRARRVAGACADRIRRFPRRVPLRVKLVLGTLTLVAVALLITGITAVAALRGYLIDRLDGQLMATAGSVADRIDRGAGLLRPPNPADNRIESPNAFVVQVFSGGGELVAEQVSPVDSHSTPALPALSGGQVLDRIGKPFTVGPAAGSARWRAIAVPLRGGTGSVTVALSLTDVDSTLARLALIELVVGAVALVLLGLLGYALVRRSLRPLREMEQTAAAIAGGELSRRVPEGDPRTEVGRLARVLNAMLAQIELAFAARSAAAADARQSEERMRQFVADASHELRTPLTSIRGFAELYRQGATTGPDDVALAMRRIEGEGTRMGMLVDDLLLLARLDQHRRLDQQLVDLVAVAADAVHDAGAVAPDRTVELVVTGTEDAAPIVRGDEARLRQVLANLTSNALTHTPPGTAIRVRVGTALVDGRRWGAWEVQDEGPGIAVPEANRVFERFYRGDASRTRSRGGTGLGLSIAAAIVAAHDGCLDLVPSTGAGARFRVLLPLAEAPGKPADNAGCAG